MKQRFKKLLGLLLELPVAAVILALCFIRIKLFSVENFFRRCQVFLSSRLFVCTENPLNIVLPEEPAVCPGELETLEELWDFLVAADRQFARSLRESLEKKLGGLAFDQAEDWSPYAADIPTRQQDIQRIRNVFALSGHRPAQVDLLWRCSRLIEVIGLEIKTKRAKEKWQKRTI